VQPIAPMHSAIERRVSGLSLILRFVSCKEPLTLPIVLTIVEPTALPLQLSLRLMVESRSSPHGLTLSGVVCCEYPGLVNLSFPGSIFDLALPPARGLIHLHSIVFVASTSHTSQRQFQFCSLLFSLKIYVCNRSFDVDLSFYPPQYSYQCFGPPTCHLPPP